MGLLGMPIMPRAKFLQNITLNIIVVCIGGAVALLQGLVATSARKATTPATASHGTHVGSSGSRESSEYNAAASAVSGLGLFITIYIVSYLRAIRPQLIFQTIIYSIFTIVASIYSPQFPNMAAVESFVKRLMEAFLTGFGISVSTLYIHLMTFPSILRFPPCISQRVEINTVIQVGADKLCGRPPDNLVNALYRVLEPRQYR